MNLRAVTAKAKSTYPAMANDDEIADALAPGRATNVILALSLIHI